MLTFNVILGYHARASYSDTSYDFFLVFFFLNPTDRPNIRKGIRR